MKAHIIALSAVAVVSLAGNGYLYHQLNQLNTSCEALNSSYTAANAEYAEQVKLGETLAKEAENLKAEIAKKEALAAQATKTVLEEEEQVASQPEKKEDRAVLYGNTTVTSNGYRTDYARKNFSFLTDEEYDQKITIFEKIKANKQNKNNAHYDGPLGNTMYDYLTPEEQELYIKIKVSLGRGTREQIIAELEEQKQTLEPPPTEFVRGEHGGATGGPISSIWA